LEVVLFPGDDDFGDYFRVESPNYEKIRSMNLSCQITIKGKFLPSNLNGIIVIKLKLYKVPIEGSRLDGEAMLST
jgi:hypothetical protein